MQPDVPEILRDEFLLALADEDVASWGARLDAGLAVDEKLDSSGRTALILAAGAGKLAMCRFLLERGAEVNRCDHGQVTPLLASLGHPSTCQLLVASGADVNAADMEWRSVLGCAAEHGDKEACEIMAGAAGIEESTKEEAISAAAIGGHVHVLQCFRDAWPGIGASVWGAALRDAAGAGQSGVCRALFEIGAEGREAALVAAASRGRESVCELLLDAGVSVDAECKLHGERALHAAVKGGSLKVAQFLLERGADMHACHRRPGMTAIYCAVESLISSRIDMARLLVRFGADLAPGCVRAGDRTPFQRAVENGDVAMAKFFIEECGEDLGQRSVEGQTLAQLAFRHPKMRDFLHSMKTSLAIGDAFGHGVPVGMRQRVDSVQPAI